jgi:hypothetical protein
MTATISTSMSRPARRTLCGIDQQIAKTERAVIGDVPVKRNRFIQLRGGQRSVNRALQAKAHGIARLKTYLTNIDSPDTGTRHRRLRAALADREDVPDVQHDLHLTLITESLPR